LNETAKHIPLRVLRAPRKFSVCGEWGAEKGCCKTMQIYAFLNFVVRALLILGPANPAWVRKNRLTLRFGV
jgi:hypothetical protein